MRRRRKTGPSGNSHYQWSVSTLIYTDHSQNDSGDLRGVAGGDGKLGCLCGI